MKTQSISQSRLLASFLACCLIASILAPQPGNGAPSPIGTGVHYDISLGPLQDPSVINQKWPGLVTYTDAGLDTWLYDVYVPPTYDGNTPFGVVVYTSGGVNRGEVLTVAPTNKNLIWIAPRYVDNSQAASWRLGVSLRALYRAKELFNIDPRRMYTSGVSGGGRVSNALAYLHPELVRGTAPSSGVGIPVSSSIPDYIPDVDGKGDTFYDYLNVYFFGLNIASVNSTAKSYKMRSFLMSRYNDYRLCDVIEGFHCGVEPQGQIAFLYNGPGTHQDATDTEMEMAIDYLDRDDIFPVNANTTAGANGFSNMTNISQSGASASASTGSGKGATTSFTLTPTATAVAAIKSGSSFYWDNPNGSTVRWLWEVKNAAPTNQKTCFGLWFTNETWGGGAPVSVTSGTNPGILITITQNGSQNHMVVSARPDSGGETVFYEGNFSFVPAYATGWTSTSSGYLASVGSGNVVEMRLDLNQSRWQLTFNGIALDGSTTTIARGTEIEWRNKRSIFGYWDSALSAAFWKHGKYTSWNNTWSPFTKSIVTVATGAISSSGATPSAMDLRYVIASDPNLPNPPPPGPDNTYASGYNNSVRLSWSACTGATSYNIKRSGTSGSGYSVLASGTALSYIDTSATNGSTYYYEVTAQTANGESAIGSEVRATPEPNSLIADLRFDESSGSFASDSTGHGWNGSLVNSAGWGTGKISSALSLTGASSQYATLPTGVLNEVTDCTISAWIKPTTLSMWMRVFDFGTGTGNYMFLAPKAGSSNVRFGMLTPLSGGEQFIESSSPITPGEWTHLAVTISGSVGTLYVNGVVSGTNNALPLNPASLGSTTQNYIGKSQWNDPYFDGLIDHFQIYSRALTGSEVGALAAPPAAPGGLTASGSVASVILSWNAVSGATGYNVMRSLTSGGGYSTIGTAVQGTSLTDTGRENATTYYYRVTALNGLSEGPASAETSATTFSSPTVAGSLIASGTMGSAFAYQITASSSPTSYGATGLPSGLSLDSSSGLISGVPTVSGSYSVNLSATNGVGTGSATLVIYVISDQFVAPIGLSATGSNVAVTLNWYPVTGAVSYKIKRSTTSGTNYTIVTSGVSATTYRDPNVTNWTPYYYVVSAVNGSGQESANSAEASATPMPPTTWIGNGADSYWQTAGNWSSQPVSGDTLYFAGSAKLTSTNNYPANTAFGGLLFNSGGGAFFLRGNSLALQGDIVNNSSNSQTLNLGIVLAGANRIINTASGNVSISSVIAETGGSFGLIKTGNNTLTLSGVSTFSGGVSLNAGTLSVANSSSGSSGPLGSGTLTLAGGTLNNSGASSACTIANPINVAGSSSIQVIASQNLQLNGIWTGSGVVNIGGSANMSLYLNGTNTMTSGTVVFANSNTSLRISNPSFGNAAVAWVFNNTTANRETFDFDSGTIDFGSISGSGILQGNGGATKTISAGALGYNDIFSGIIQDGGATVALVKTGTGRLTLSADNPYNAGTTINAGSLNITGALTGAGAVAVNSGGTLAGTGTISAATSVASGGAIAPGNGGIGVSGTLAFSNTGTALTLDGGSVLNLDLSGTTTSDQIAVSGTVIASGTTTVNLKALASFAASGTYPVITSTGTLSAANFAIGNSIPGYCCVLSASNGTLSVIVSNQLPSAPTGLMASPGHGTVALGWTAVPGAATYNVKRSVTSGSGYATIAPGVIETSYNDPTAINDTTYYYVVSAVNSVGESANSSEASATPNANILAPVITSAASATGTNGSAFNYNITATDSPISYGASGLPAGLNVNTGSGLISGTPTATGTFNATVSATNTIGTGIAALTITVMPPPPAPVISSASSASGTSGRVFSYQITAVNYPTSFGASGLPAGLSVNTANGLIGGTLSATGTYNATISAANLSGTGSATLTISVLNAASTTCTWTGGGANALWQTGANWTTVPLAGDSLVFAGASQLSNTNDYAAGTQFSAISFSSGAGAFVLNGNSFSLSGAMQQSSANLQTINCPINLTNTGGSVTHTIGSGGLTLNGSLSNSSNIRGITLSGAGTLTLNGSTTWNFGGADYSSPYLNGGNLTIGSGGSLTVNGAANNYSGYFNIAGTSTLNILSGGFFAVNGRSASVSTTGIGTSAGDNVVVNVSGTASYGDGTNLQIGGNSSGSSTVNINSGGLLSLNNTARSMALATSGTLNLNSGGTLASARTWSAGVGTLAFKGGVFKALSNQSLASGNTVMTTSTDSTIDANSYSVSIGNAISGTGGIVIASSSGSGSVTLGGSSPYTGSTRVISGQLNLTGALTGTSSVSVANGGTICGSGTLSGTVSVSSGGIVSPGNGGAGVSGTLTVLKTLTLNNAVLNLDLSGTTSSDRISCTGLVASGTTTVNLNALAGFAGAGTYPIINASGSAANFVIGTKPAGYSCAITATNGTLAVLVGSVPAAPTGLSATAANNAVTLNWTASSGADSYNVKRSGTSATGYTTITSAITGTTYVDSTGTNGGTYYYVVSAVNLLGESSNSNEASATVVILDGTPPVITVPGNLTATATGANGAVVTFSTSALDAVSGTCATTNNPASGSVFPIGTTVVTTTAADAAGNTGQATFTVTVQTLPISSEEQQRSSSISLSGSSGTLTFKSPVPGHAYQLQYCDDLATGNWQNAGQVQVGDGSDLQFDLPTDSTKPRRFYRLQIQK